MKKIVFILFCSVLAATADKTKYLKNSGGYQVNLQEQSPEELRAQLIQKFRESIKKQMSARLYEEELRALLENFRDTVINGNPEKGIPILDPYVTEELSANAVIPATGTFNITMQNVEITGLKDFIVDQINFALINLRLDYAFTLPELNIKSEHYNLIGDIIGDFDLFGNGTLRWTALNTKIDGYAKLIIKDGNLYMNVFEISIDIDNFESDIQGLLDDGDQCFFLNQVLQQLIPSIFITQRAFISEVVGEKVKEFANQYLTELTLADLIDLITGGGGLVL